MQFLSCGKSLRPGSSHFKGLKQVDSYQEGGMWKYTVGASTDLKEIQALRREVARLFPEAFVVAFRDGVRVDINDARQHYQQNQKK